MRVVAILASYNEERFIAGCLEHLFGQGVEAYLVDNASTDRTVEIAEGYLGRGLVGIETLPRVGGVHRWRRILARKEEIAASLDADWFMHADPDEVRLPPRSDRTLAEALAEVDGQGYNAVNFLEFTFVPTREAPEHDHPDFARTMRWYYPFMRNFPFRVNAWKRQPEPVDLRHGNGHKVRFPGLCVYPWSFKMKHYQFLSLEQARIKYLEKKKYDAADVRKAHWRYWLVEERMGLPSESELHLSRLFPKSPLVRRLFPAAQELSGPTTVDWVSGACMAVRRRTLEEIGPMDERFFMYFEDADLCRRAREAGWLVYYLPQVGIFHHSGASSGDRPRAIRDLHKSAFLYHRKHGPHGPLGLYDLLVLLGLTVRAGAKLAASCAKG